MGDRSPVDPETFREAMSHLAAPVTVVTGRDPQGRPTGLTVSAVMSVSAIPPLVAVGVARASGCHPALVTGREFSVNVLAPPSRSTALRFATPGVDRFAGREVTAWQGSDLPYLGDAAVALRCSLERVVTAGDHDLLLGMVTDVCFPAVTVVPHPLVWFRRGFLPPWDAGAAGAAPG